MQPLGAGPGSVAPKDPKSILYKVMLHIKSKVMKSRIQRYKNFECFFFCFFFFGGGGERGRMSGVTKGKKVGPFLLSHNSS